METKYNTEDIKNIVNLISLEFTEYGEKINDNIGIVEIFYINSKKKCIRKNRMKKNRRIRIGLENRYKINYPYLINLKEFWEHLASMFSPKKIVMSLEEVTRYFLKMLKKYKIKDIGNDRIKVTNIYYLPDYSSPFYIKKVSFYFKTLKRKLMKGKHKNFFFVIRKAEIYHEIMMKEKNLNYPRKKKVRKTIQVGDNYNYSLKKFVSLKRVIDKDRKVYGEEIKNKETGEVIRECYEPLQKHQGRGNAKN